MDKSPDNKEVQKSIHQFREHISKTFMIVLLKYLEVLEKFMLLMKDLRIT